MERTLQAELRQTKPFASREEETLLNLERTADCFRREMQQTLKPFGITATQYNVLRILRGAGQAGLGCSELSDRMVASDPDITRLLERLDREGMVRRRRHEGDRRIVLTVITEAGLQLLETAVPMVDAMLRGLLGHMRPEELDRLIELLEAARAPYRRCPGQSHDRPPAETEEAG
jgi:DNA-binding MarR family transcriptional regulator